CAELSLLGARALDSPGTAEETDGARVLQDLDPPLREHGLAEGPLDQRPPDAEVDEVLVARARRTGEPRSQIEFLRASIENGGANGGRMDPAPGAAGGIEGMRLEEVGDALARPVEGALAGRHLERVPLHEKDAMPGASDGQGGREARRPGAEHCHTDGLHERT